MTWLGWFLTIELVFSSAVMFYRAGQGDTIRTPKMALFQGIEMLILAILVVSVGTGSLL